MCDAVEENERSAAQLLPGGLDAPRRLVDDRGHGTLLRASRQLDEDDLPSACTAKGLKVTFARA
jgi:hypothetical protein